MITSPQMSETLTPEHKAEERRTLGFARVREAIFDAVDSLWQQRQLEGVKKKDLAEAIGYHPSQITRALAGPGNWTLETVGALVEAMDGELHVEVRPRESCMENYDIYADLIDGVAHKFCPAILIVNENWPHVDGIYNRATASAKRNLTSNVCIKRESF